MTNEFNSFASPKIETKRFKIYANVGTPQSPEWELQGRGVENWSISENEDVTKTTDVLGFVDMERGVAQPTQSGVVVRLREGSKLAQLLFYAWNTRQKSMLDSVQILQKFEFIDGEEEGTCLARLENGVMISITDFNGEAGGYLSFTFDIHYANDSTIGTMQKVDGETVTFTPASGA